MPDSHSLIDPSTAVLMAKAVYGVQDVSSVRQATAELAGPGVPGLREDFDLSGSAIAGESGAAMLTKATGFGMVLKGKGRFAGDVAVVCRGTASIRDVLTDLNAGLANGPGGKIHTGFARTYGTMRDDVNRSMGKMGSITNIHLIGHSLGGALATVFASQFAREGRGNVHLYTFGCPRVGTHGFCDGLEDRVPTSQIKRVYAMADPVPMVPIWPFEHTDGGLHTAQGGTIFNPFAHKLTNYGAAVANKGWGALSTQAAGLDDKRSVDYWVQRASNASPIPGSSYLLGALGAALKAVLKLINVTLGGAFTAGVTLIDGIVMALYHGVRFMGEQVSFWIRSIIKGIFAFVGRMVDGAMDLTEAFLRYVVGLLLRSITTAVRQALDTFFRP